jgi:hypothetical protein
MGWVDLKEQHIYTEAPIDQIPGSPALRRIGPIRVRAHAISCVASDEDLRSYEGSYLDRAQKLWWASTPEALKQSIGMRLGNDDAANWLIGLKAEEKALEDQIHQITLDLGGTSSYPVVPTVDPALVAKLNDLRAQLEKMQLKNALAFRKVVFRGANDCTVSQTSSSGGLAPPFQTTIGNVLHGFASQYPSVQNRVLELLKSEGKKFFTPDGFPDTYAPKPGAAPTWGQLLVPPAHSAGTAPAPK